MLLFTSLHMKSIRKEIRMLVIPGEMPRRVPDFWHWKKVSRCRIS